MDESDALSERRQADLREPEGFSVAIQTDDVNVWKAQQRLFRVAAQAERGIDDMCQDVWRWQSSNPNGYEG